MGKATKSRAHLFRKPAGASERTWNNVHMGTSRGPKCGLCGTKWPEGNDVTLGRFLGLEIVEQCCGRVLDTLYRESGEEFALAFLGDFADNPLDSRFGFLEFMLPEILSSALKKLESHKVQLEAAKGLTDKISAVNKQIPEAEVPS